MNILNQNTKLLFKFKDKNTCSYMYIHLFHEPTNSHIQYI